MGNVVSQVFGGGTPKKEDTSAIEAANARAEARVASKEAEQAAERSSRIRAARGRNSGRNLLANLETGFEGVSTKSDTLGA